MRLICDAMLGKLAKWLRILGFDTLYEREIKDRELIEKVRKRGRILLTADRRLAVRKILRGKVILINSFFLKEQLKETIEKLHLEIRREIFFSRCLICNSPLLPICKEKIKSRVPSYVYKTISSFSICPLCDKIYWSATHRERMVSRLKCLLEV
jgi:hypothetical protein